MPDKRRALIDGLGPSANDDRSEEERQFVFQPTSKPTPDRSQAQTPNSSKSVRVPITTRFPQEVAERLKRTAFERQMAGRTPCSMQDILAEALEMWFAKNGDSDQR